MIFKYLSAGLVTAAIIGVIGYEIKISGLNGDIEDLTKTVDELAVRLNDSNQQIGSLRNDKFRLQASIVLQNKEVEKQRLDTIEKNKKILAWENEEDHEKYKVFYDRLIDVDASKSNCERYEDVKDALNGFDLDSL